MADAGPPIFVIAVGLVLWLAVKATLAGISIQTIGLIVTLAGIAWLVLELWQTRLWTRPRGAVAERPVVRERERVY